MSNVALLGYILLHQLSSIKTINVLVTRLKLILLNMRIEQLQQIQMSELVHKEENTCVI
jgi:hypothetical protein